MTFPHTSTNENRIIKNSIAQFIHILQLRYWMLFGVLLDGVTLLEIGYRFLPITRGFYIAYCMRSSCECLCIGFIVLMLSFCETGTITVELCGMLLSTLLLRILRAHIVNTRFARRIVSSGVFCLLQLFLWFLSHTMIMSWWHVIRTMCMLCVVFFEVE